MNDEFIMFNDDETYQESCESDESVTIEDVEAYLESLSTDIDEAEDLRDNMIQEEYEYEDLTLEDVETYIETSIDKYNDVVDTVNGIIQEADEATDDSSVDDFEESRDPSWSGENNGSDPRADLRKYMNDPNVQPWDKKQILDRANKANDLSLKRVIRRSRRDNVEEMPSRQYLMWKKDRDTWNDVADRDENEGLTHAAANSRKRANESQRLMNDIKDQRLAGKRASVNEYALTSYRDNELDLELDEPLTAYEFFDESYEPDDEPFVPYTDEGIYIEADSPEKNDLTLGGAIVIGAGLGTAVGTGLNIINMLITEHKYGRFPHDMKRVYDIVQKADFKASTNKRILKKALKAVSKDLRWMFNGIGGRWKVTVNEAAELKKLKKHVDDLYTRGWMLTRNEELSQKRRVPERIAEFVEQGNKVLKILSKSVYKNPADDVTTEYMV